MNHLHFSTHKNHVKKQPSSRCALVFLSIFRELAKRETFSKPSVKLPRSFSFFVVLRFRESGHCLVNKIRIRNNGNVELQVEGMAT